MSLRAKLIVSDDDYIQTEIRSMFVRCNFLIRKFSNYSKAVKLKLFQSFCLCFFMILPCDHHSTELLT